MPRPESPVDPLAGPIERFAHDLRKLREHAGSPGYRELGARAHYSASTLADAARGHKLPSLAVTLAFVRACGGDETTWRERWQSLNDTTTPQAPDSPYVGLNAFTEADTERFFGRERLVTKLRDKLAHHDLVVVIGASGSGKSSLLRAGLLATDDRPQQLITPGAHPLRHELLDEGLLVVDQFEELFTLCHDLAERTAFIKTLLDNGAQVVLGLRADFYGHCAAHPDLVDALEDAQVLVGPMTTDELRSAITQPAVQAGCTLETALVARLIADATGEPGVLPHVSHALLETWARRRGNTLTLASYEDSGGIARAVAQTAENAYTALDPDQQRQARHVFLRLTNPGDGTEDTKRRVHRDELGDATDVLDHLAAARLLTLDGDTVEISHEAVIRSWPRLREWISEDREGLRIHRKLTAAAAEWEAHNRDPGALYRGLPLSIAADWSTRTQDALNPHEQAFLDASNNASRNRTRQLRRLVALLSVLLLVAAVSTGIAIRAQLTATENETVALVEKAVVDANTMQRANPALAAQLRLAAYRLRPLPSARDSLLSTFSSPFATRITAHTNATHGAAFRPDDKVLATTGSDNVLVFWDTADPHRPAELGRVSGFTDYIHDLKFSRDGRLLFTAGRDNTARIWDVADPRAPRELAKITAHTATVQAVAITPDNRTLVTASEDRTIKIWDIADPRSPRQLTSLGGHTDLVHGMAMTPDGRLLATASWDGTMRLWDTSTPAAARELKVITEPQGKAFQSVGFSPDGTLLATGNDDRTARLWNVADPANPTLVSTLVGHTGAVHDLDFSPDGTTLATASEDKTARLWDIRDRAAPILTEKLDGHTDLVWEVDFSHDGTQLVTTSDDRSIRIHDLRELPVTAHTNGVWTLAFDRAGRFIVTGGEDHIVRLWRPDGPHASPLAALPASSAPLRVASLSPGGDVLVTANIKSVTTLWDTTDPANPRELTRLPPGAAWDAGAAFSNDGRTLLTIGGEGEVRIWDLADPRAPRQLAAFKQPTEVDPIAIASFTSDDRIVAIASGDNQILLYDVSDRSRPRALPPLTTKTNVLAAAFHGNTLAVSVGDNTAILWDLRDARKPQLLASFTGAAPASQIAFSNDGRRFATAGNDQVIRVWDITNPSAPVDVAALTGHTDRIWGLAFGADGATLASTGADRTLRLWDTDVERVAARVCSVVAPPRSEAEWGRRFVGGPFREPC